MIVIPQINYSTILALVVCIGFFAKGAHMDGRSPFLWGALSFLTWLAFTTWCMTGVAGLIVSQLSLFVGLTLFELRRERSTRETRDARK